MAKKKTTKKAAPKTDVNKTQEIKKALAASPDKGPKEISDALKAKGLDIKPGYVSTIKTNLKAKAKKAPKKKAVAKKKATGKKPAAKVSAATDITFEQLCKAKELAQELGGVDKAKEALSALAQLTG